MDTIKEIIIRLCNALDIPVNRYIRHYIGLDNMKNGKTITINLDPKSFNIGLTLKYTICLQVITCILFIGCIKLYDWFVPQFTAIYGGSLIVKTLTIILFTYLFVFTAYRQHELFGIGIGEIVKGDTDINYNYKGYTYLFINTVIIYIIFLTTLIFTLYNHYNILNYYLTPIIILLNLINFLIYSFTRTKRLLMQISKVDKVTIKFNNGSKYEHQLFDKSFEAIKIRIRYDNNIYIYDWDTRYIKLYNPDEINSIIIGSNTLIYTHNQWIITI